MGNWQIPEKVVELGFIRGENGGPLSEFQTEVLIFWLLHTAEQHSDPFQGSTVSRNSTIQPPKVKFVG